MIGELVAGMSAVLAWDLGRRWLAREVTAIAAAREAAAKAEEAQRAAEGAREAAGQLVQSVLEKVTQMDHRLETLEIVDQVGRDG